MGNRAVVSFKDGVTNSKHGVYLHWNGGPESVLAFAEVMGQRKWTRMDYASARFASIAIELFDLEGDDHGLSVGIVDEPENYVDGCDNGEYLIAWDMPGQLRVFHNGDTTPLDPRGASTAIVKALQDARKARQRDTTASG